MHKQLTPMTPILLLLILFSAFNCECDAVAAQDKNPFTPKAFLIRYWDKKISNNLPKPQFLLSKASPLSAVESATFAKLAANHTLSKHLSQFCSSAHLLCTPHLSAPTLANDHEDSNFAVYDNKNFTNYGTGRRGGVDSFKNYSEFKQIPVNDFRRYSQDSSSHKDNFLSYGSGGNLVEQSFHVYATGATSGAGEFNRYADPVNGTGDLRFTTYSQDANGRSQSFASYAENGNAGDQSFTGYGKHGNEARSEFSSYGTSSNGVVSGFSNYGEVATSANETFKNYAAKVNDPTNNFKNYGNGGNGATDSFANYKEEANDGSDSFLSYANQSKAANVEFSNYGKFDNLGSDRFTGYGEGAQKHKLGFKGYGVNTTFKAYAKHGVTFADYKSGSLVKKWVEPGKFFSELMLKEGTVRAMPDIRDKMPERSFLPRAILSKLPFSVSEVKQVFNVARNSSLEKIVIESVNECERAPSQGETKRCVGSIEDMVDFATEVLGRNIAVRTTKNINGSKKSVTVGSVKGINGGRVTQSVSCHRSLFPYLLYYCHSVPKVRVYEADLLDPNSKAKINHGVAICHLDTSTWSPSHGAFLVLGSGPGQIEVCHWIFENDMTWTIAD